jgi:chromosome segregation ATPase
MEREKFTPRANIKTLVSINDLIKHDKEQIKLLAEFLLFLLAISSKKNYFLDKIYNEDNKFINCLLYHVEKYLLFDKQDEKDFLNQSIGGYTRLKDEYEKEIADLRSKNDGFELLVHNLEDKLKEREKELDTVKKNNTLYQEVHQEAFNGTIMFNQLKAELDQKELEIKDIVRQHQLIDNKNRDTIKKLNENIEKLNETSNEYHNLKAQYDKLNIKYKEALTKREEYDELVRQFENKAKQNDNFQKERNMFILEIEKLNKELMTEKEKLKNVDYERRKLEMELMDRTALKEHNNFKVKEIYTNTSQFQYKPSFNQSEIREEGDCVKLIDVGSDSMFLEDDRRFSGGHNIEVEVHKAERDTLVNHVNELKYKLDKEYKEKEKVLLQKEKCEVQVQRLKLDNQKLEMEIERYENDNKRLQEDSITYEKEKALIEYLRKELEMKSASIKQLTSGNNGLEIDNDRLRNDFTVPSMKKTTKV